MKEQRARILGYGVDCFSFDEALDYAVKTGGHVITINPEIISTARHDNELTDVIENAELVIPDGIGVELGLKILGYNVRRIAGITFGRALIQRFASENKKIAFVGAKPGVAEKAVENIKKDIPNIDVVYCHDGYFKDDDEIISQLKAASADLVLVALGAPKQEFFINKLKKIMPNSLMIGLGGSFDVWAGIVERAPEIWQNLGLEWLYRTIKEPKRFRRIFPTLPLFVLNVLKERLMR